MKSARAPFAAPILAALLALAVLAAAPAMAEDRDAGSIPLPSTISPELRAYITKEKARPNAAALIEGMKGTVDIAEDTMGGVPVFVVTPKSVAPEFADKVVLEFHGGGFIEGDGVSSLKEALLTAHFAGIKVVHPDYRLAPLSPYPAAVEDAASVYRELLKTCPAGKIAVMGTSAGGGLALSLMLKAKELELPLPGALVAGTPCSDLTKTGDTYFTLAGVDDCLGAYEGYVKDCVIQYSSGHDLKDPLLSPVYGDMSGFPPTMLGSGTRDLFLSNTVRVQAKLREAGVPADLVVIEGLSHAEYILSPEVPETIYYYGQVANFLRANLK